MVEWLRDSGLAGVEGVVHGFTTRAGGVSAGPLASLNLARRDGESDDRLVRNWGLAVGELVPGWGADRVALVNQVHGARVMDGRPAGPLAPLGEADALVTDAVGVVLAVRVADCVPVLMAAGRAVAAVHAGWQGTAAGVVPAALERLLELSGTGPEAVVVAVGPSICGRCYEVGPEVVDGLHASGAADFEVGRSARGRPLVDVAAAVVSQLHAQGVHRIGRVAACTFEDPRLWSHRRHGAASGRQAALIARCA